MKNWSNLLLASLLFAACNSSTETKTDSSLSSDTATGMTDVANGQEQYTYTPAAGDVTYRNNKVKIWRDNAWVDADQDVQLDSGVVVYRNGRVVRNDREIQLEDGEVVNRTGNFFDKTGKAIDNAWDATKRGVKKAGDAVGKAAKKVGDKVDDAFDKDRKDTIKH